MPISLLVIVGVVIFVLVMVSVVLLLKRSADQYWRREWGQCMLYMGELLDILEKSRVSVDHANKYRKAHLYYAQRIADLESKWS